MPGPAHSSSAHPSAPSSAAGRGNLVGGNLRHGGLRFLRLRAGNYLRGERLRQCAVRPRALRAPPHRRHLQPARGRHRHPLAHERRRARPVGQLRAVRRERAAGSSIDFAASLYPGRRRGLRQGRRPLRADGAARALPAAGRRQHAGPVAQPDLRHLARATRRRRRSTPRRSRSNRHFLRSNQTLTVSIDDTIGGDPIFVFPRPLQRSVWDRRGVCVPGLLPAGGAVPAGRRSDRAVARAGAAVGHRALLRGRARGAEPTAAIGADDQIAIDTVPEVFDGDQPHVHGPDGDDAVHLSDRPRPQHPGRRPLPGGDAGNPVEHRRPCSAQYSALRALPMIDLSAGIDPADRHAGHPLPAVAVPCARRSGRRPAGQAGRGRRGPSSTSATTCSTSTTCGRRCRTSLTQSLADFSQDHRDAAPAGRLPGDAVAVGTDGDDLSRYAGVEPVGRHGLDRGRRSDLRSST